MYVCWLLRYGCVSVTDRISNRQDVLQAVMRSRSLGLISFFFKGTQSHEDGAAFLSPACGADGGSYVLRLFFEANVTYTTWSDLIFSSEERGNLGSRENAIHLRGEGWDEHEVSAKADRIKILSCYWYLLSTYPHARIPLQPSFFKVLIEDVQLHCIISRKRDNYAGYFLSSSGDIFGKDLPRQRFSSFRDDYARDFIALIMQEHDSRFRRRRIDRFRRMIPSPYLIRSPADGLLSDHVVAVMSIIPGITLDDFTPSIFWLPCSCSWLTTIALSLLALVFWLLRRLVLFLSGLWTFQMPGGLWNFLFFPLFIVAALAAIVKFVVRIILTVIMVASILLAVATLAQVGWTIYNFVGLRRFAWPLNWSFLILAVHAAVSSILLVVLDVIVCTTSFWLKQAGGIAFIPYFF